MQTLSTKCPTLNKDYQNKKCQTTPDLEVLVRIYDGKGDQVESPGVQGIICPEYDSDGKTCKISKDLCHYLVGFQVITV